MKDEMDMIHWAPHFDGDFTNLFFNCDERSGHWSDKKEDVSCPLCLAESQKLEKE